MLIATLLAVLSAWWLARRLAAPLERLARIAARLRRARLHYGHGTLDASDDAAAIVAHVLGQLPARC